LRAGQAIYYVGANAGTASEYLNVKEAAALLGQHEVTVRRHIAAGELRGVRLGPNGRVRIPRAALDAFVQPYAKEQQ
jgi:excisionase family DNA binding protein